MIIKNMTTIKFIFDYFITQQLRVLKIFDFRKINIYFRYLTVLIIIIILFISK